MWQAVHSMTVSSVQKQEASSEFNEREQTLSNKQLTDALEQWTVSMRETVWTASVYGQCWSGPDWTATWSSSREADAALHSISPLTIPSATWCRWCAGRSGTCATRPEQSSSTAHTSGSQLHTENKYIILYSITPTVHSERWQRELAGTSHESTSMRYRYYSMEKGSTWVTRGAAGWVRATRTGRSGGSPASPPSGRSAESVLPSARSAAASQVASALLTRSEKQPASRSVRRRRSRSLSPAPHWCSLSDARSQVDKKNTARCW